MSLVTHWLITVFTSFACCGSCWQLYLALSLCVIIKLADPAAAPNTCDVQTIYCLDRNTFFLKMLVKMII